jgi:low temperature requirement protein LtrA
MSNHPTWRGIGYGMLVLAAIWWLWTGYAWLTNSLEPEESVVRAGMVAAMATMFLVALAVPEAFGAEAMLFGGGYLVVRPINLALYLVATRRDRDLLQAFERLAPAGVIGPTIILVAGFLHRGWRVALWLIALVIIYAGALIGRGRGWHISPAHFAERYGLIVIIALGESVISLGVAAAHISPLAPGIVAAAVLGILVIAALWWAYFDVLAVIAERQLADTSGATRARLARDYYSYLQLPMIAGIVLFALGLKATIEKLDEPLAVVPAVALCGGLSLYFLTHVAQRIRLVYLIRHTRTDMRPGWIGPGRLAAGVAMLLLLPAALALPALTSLAVATAICAGLIAWDLIHYREDRVDIRRQR